MNLENCKCLILSADYRPKSVFPLSTITWQDAIKLQFLKKIKVLEWYEQTVNSPSISMKIPAVAVVKKYYHKGNKEIQLTKHNIFLRDTFRCQYCLQVFSQNELTIDHYIPTSKGGAHTWENLTTSCLKCNLKKADSVNLFIPNTLPYKPDNNLIATKKQKMSYVILHDSWSDYLK